MMSYCYWSIAMGDERRHFEECLRTARECGVYKDFHAFTDQPMEECECYELPANNAEPLLLRILALKVGLSKLRYDAYVWLAPRSLFLSNPSDLLGALRVSPIHIPLEANVELLTADSNVCSLPALDYRQLCQTCGVGNSAYSGSDAFWIVTRDAIDVVAELASIGFQKAKKAQTPIDATFPLMYAMQMLCGDPSVHTVASRPDLWAAQYDEKALGESPPQGPWTFTDRSECVSCIVNPSILYRPAGGRCPSLIDPTTTLYELQ